MHAMTTSACTPLCGDAAYSYNDGRHGMTINKIDAQRQPQLVERVPTYRSPLPTETGFQIPF